jgi:4-diphosphocytidyl-2-C-methyl-D-erythritol kinase
MTDVLELPLRTQAAAKINLGLRVGPTRPDGKHELVTVMQSISLADELTLSWAPPESSVDEVICPGVEGENLAAHALGAFRQATGWQAPPLRLEILKRIPVAAGLGGGSSDAAGALQLAQGASGLGDERLLFELAGGLGADVPGMLRAGRWLSSGAGERLEALAPPNPPFGVLVLPLAQELSTAAVYQRADRLGIPRPARELDSYRRELHAALDFGASTGSLELLANDLQAAAVDLCPEIERGLTAMRDSGADVSFVSGSGPTVIGLFLRANPPARVTRALAALEGRQPRPIAAIPVEAQFGTVQRLGTSQLHST